MEEKLSNAIVSFFKSKYPNYFIYNKEAYNDDEDFGMTIDGNYDLKEMVAYLLKELQK